MHGPEDEKKRKERVVFPRDAFPESAFPEDVFPSDIFPRDDDDAEHKEDC